MRRLEFFAVACLLLAPPLCTQSSSGPARPPQSKPTFLEPGKRLESTLQGGGKRTYEIHAEASQFIHAVVEQIGIDVGLNLYAPDGTLIGSMDSPNGSFGLEQISAIAEVQGIYRLEVVCGDKNAPAGQYRVTVEPLRTPKDQDRARIAAERTFAEAVQLAGRGSPDSLRAAIQQYLTSLPLWRVAGDRYEEAWTEDSIGAAYAALSENQKALDYYNQALPLKRAIGDRAGEAEELTNIGSVYLETGEIRKGLDYDTQALPLMRVVGDRAGEANNLTSIGSAYSILGEKQKALDYYNQALPLWRAVEDRADEAATLNAIGLVYSDLGEKQKALDSCNQALPLAHAVGDRKNEARALDFIGIVYRSLGEEQKALDNFDQALEIRRAVADRTGEAIALEQIGAVYEALGDKEKALDNYNQALPLMRAVGDRASEAATLHNIGFVYADIGEHQKALDYYNLALELMRAVGDRKNEATILNNIGQVYADLREQQKAQDYYGQALTLSRLVRDRSNEARTLSNIGRVYADLGERQKALDYYNQALPLAHTVGDRMGEARILSYIEFSFQRSDQDLAITFGKQAVNILQGIRQDNKGLQESLRSSYEKSIESYYRTLADLLIERARFGEAEEVLNLLKDKEASDFIRRDSVGDQLRPATLLEFEKKALDRYDQIVDQIVTLGKRKSELIAKHGQSGLNAAESEELTRLDHDLTAANTVLQRYFEDEEKVFAADSGLINRMEEFKGAQDLQGALQKLGPDVVAIYTLVTPDKYVALLVTGTAQKAYTTSIQGRDLNKKILDFRQQLQNPSSDPLPLAEELYHIVFPEGLREDLNAIHAKTVMWSIDGTLRYIPLAALYDGADYLVKSFRQSLITPASLAYLTEEPIRQWEGEGFGVSNGDSPLPMVPAELHGIFRETAASNSPIPGMIRLNATFTRENFRNDLTLKRNPVVHIATHFDSRPGVAANSQLLLGDGKLSLAEIAAQTRLFEGVDLLTLSACNTAFTNRSEDGREVDSFGTIAERLGARGVIASLWSVNDDSTASLMQTMYRLRQANTGMTKSEALRQAQVLLLAGQLKSGSAQGASNRGGKPNRPQSFITQTSNWSHPYYWAPFILIGNWK
ncbi:MAG: tetratricopeptide repeat protein [Terracidiphilus sp.]|jgi:CHAT domain-containing protein/Tfp pilus assembly protein PilF